jgi:hypothetical protein
VPFKVMQSGFNYILFTDKRKIAQNCTIPGEATFKFYLPFNSLAVSCLTGCFFCFKISCRYSCRFNVNSLNCRKTQLLAIMKKYIGIDPGGAKPEFYKRTGEWKQGSIGLVIADDLEYGNYDFIGSVNLFQFTYEVAAFLAVSDSFEFEAVIEKPVSVFDQNRSKKSGKFGRQSIDIGKVHCIYDHCKAYLEYHGINVVSKYPNQKGPKWDIETFRKYTKAPNGLEFSQHEIDAVQLIHHELLKQKAESLNLPTK